MRNNGIYIWIHFFYFFKERLQLLFCFNRTIVNSGCICHLFIHSKSPSRCFLFIGRNTINIAVKGYTFPVGFADLRFHIAAIAVQIIRNWKDLSAADCRCYISTILIHQIQFFRRCQCQVYLLIIASKTNSCYFNFCIEFFLCDFACCFRNFCAVICTCITRCQNFYCIAVIIATFCALRR